MALLADVWANLATSLAPFPESASPALLIAGMIDRALARDEGAALP
jgi:hypothetical protein